MRAGLARHPTLHALYSAHRHSMKSKFSSWLCGTTRFGSYQLLCPHSSCHSALLTGHGPHWPPSCSPNTLSTFLLQGLCIGYSLCFEHLCLGNTELGSHFVQVSALMLHSQRPPYLKGTPPHWFPNLLPFLHSTYQYFIS